MSLSSGETALFSNDKITWVEAEAYEFDYSYAPYKAITSKGRFRYYKQINGTKIFTV
jgi:hypothetical protein